MVENETGLKVKSLRSNNDGECTYKEFKQYYDDNGIVMFKTILGRPQQNGVAERMNRTLNERGRSMRLHSGLPKMLSAEAVSIAADLINRCPCTRLDFKLLEEVWSGKQVNLSHFLVGSLIFMLMLLS